MFNDPDLQKVLQDNEENIKSKIALLDSISHDIKMLETTLKKSCVEKGCVLGIAEGSLVWYGKRVCWESKDKFPRPLIETPSKIRLIAFPYFPEFLDKCLKSLVTA